MNMKLKEILLKWIKKIFSDSHSAIISIIIGALILGSGSIYLFFKDLWFTLKNIMLLPTPLWGTIVLALIVVVYIYFKPTKNTLKIDDHFFLKFGVLWDKNLNMRCISCQNLLKNSTYSSSVFHCSDRKCDNKHTLRDNDGKEITQQEAINRIKLEKNIQST